MKTKILNLALIATFIFTFSSCTTYNHSMREPYTKVNLNKSDFSLSDQVSADAQTVKIIGIDWSRLFTKKTGEVHGGAVNISAASIPVVGNLLVDKTANYSLYELMNKNPGYDVVFYPQYETKIVKPILGIGFLTKITTVRTTARLGKINQ